VSVVENESKGDLRPKPFALKRHLSALSTVDPPIPNTADRAVKLRSQQEVESWFLLSREMISLV